MTQQIACLSRYVVRLCGNADVSMSDFVSILGCQLHHLLSHGLECGGSGPHTAWPLNATQTLHYLQATREH